MSDYVFWVNDIVVANDAMTEEEARAKAQRLARAFRLPVSYALVHRYNVEPDRCQVCGEVMPADGPCPCQDWE